MLWAGKCILPFASQEAVEVGWWRRPYTLCSGGIPQVKGRWRTGAWQTVHLASGEWAHIMTQALQQTENFPHVLKGSRSCFYKSQSLQAFLVAQWFRILLPMQGTRVRALVQEDPMCRGVTKPVHHNYWACALEPTSHSYWARVPQLLRPAPLEPVLCNKRSHRNETPMHHNEE